MRNEPPDRMCRDLLSHAFTGRPASLAARSPSTLSTQMASVASEAPPIIWMWVGPHAVTSWPKSPCQMSSSGKPDRATSPQMLSSTAPTGTDQRSLSRTDERPARSLPMMRARTPAKAMPSRPTMMNQCAGLANAPGSRPRSMCQETSQ